ncbi:hypothetical protein RND81_05G271400 [Saponaria officinalis]|uniref:Alkyl transferase n=1 Tax=Saponaria officinalis TaxID=3572 RepID=A0AAW1L2P0_SAPOF
MRSLRSILPRASAAFSIYCLPHSTNLHHHHLINTNHITSNSSNSNSNSNNNTRTTLPFCTSPENADDFPADLRREKMPEHVAFILDGNKRWADRRGLGSEAGHEAGLKSLLQVMGLCAKWDIKVATFFLFSSENWRRPKQEIEFVMKRFERMLVDELEDIKRKGIKISTIGEISKLSESLQKVLQQTKEATENNTKTHVIFAISYSGKNDLVQACQSIATKVRNGLVEPRDITEFLLERELETNITSNPCPDLLIRTSGEIRISNFLLWQLAYSEMYFTDTLWPDFHEPEFVRALSSFQTRGRRFGGR